MKRVLITGANRGLGLEFTRQLAELNLDIIAACREPLEASFLRQLAITYPKISIIDLDVSNDNSIDNLADLMSDISLDWLINNAGTTGEQGVTVGNIERANFLKVMDTNCFGPLKVSEALLPSLQKGEDKLIVSISSIMGSISTNLFGRSYAYRASKAALNCVMHSLAIDVADRGIKVMLLHPGWVRTDLGGPDAPIDPEDSVRGMLQVIEANKANCYADTMYDYQGQMLPW
ncbi:MAG: SDR family oxidoreductase [Tatlockia sp.]|nr:SDR family oxidoreductase [Tatlockia sp.]